MCPSGERWVYARVSVSMWTYLPPKRGHLKKGTNAVGRVHTQSSFNYTTIQILSAGNYYQYIEAINKLFCITLYPISGS